MVAPDGDWAERLARAGWSLDEGTAHAGQGTRNRRVRWADSYLELVWVEHRAEAEANRVRLDRRADWHTTGASPFGFGFRGELPDGDRPDYWLYEDLGIPIWIHRDNELVPERPLVFVLPVFQRREGEGVLRSVRLTGPSPARLPAYAGPPVAYRRGPHRLELDAGDGPALRVSELLALTGRSVPPA
jgi:hypothetical protein